MHSFPITKSRAAVSRGFTLLETVVMLVILVIFTMVVTALAIKVLKNEKSPSAPPASGTNATPQPYPGFRAGAGAEQKVGSPPEERPAAPAN